MKLNFDEATSWLSESAKFADEHMIHRMACAYDITGRTYKQRNRELIEGEDDEKIQKSEDKITSYFKEAMKTFLDYISSLPRDLQKKEICKLFSVTDPHHLDEFGKIVAEQLQDQSFQTLINSFYDYEKNEFPLDSLPTEMLVTIQDFLTEQDKLHFGMVNKDLRNLAIAETLSEYQIELILEYWIEFISESDDDYLILFTRKPKAQLIKELRFVKVRENFREVNNKQKALETINLLCKLPWVIKSEKAAILFAEGLSAGIPFPDLLRLSPKPDWKPKTLHHLAKALIEKAPQVTKIPAFTINMPQMPLVFPANVKKAGDDTDKTLSFLYAFGEVLKSIQYFSGIKLTFWHPKDEKDKITLFDPRLASLLETIISHKNGNIKKFIVRGSKRNWPTQGIKKVYQSLKKHQAECDIFFLGFKKEDLEALLPKTKIKKPGFISLHRRQS